jgi:8-oxo-dGTP pyrophosphatase MutT (NUDIX family)
MTDQQTDSGFEPRLEPHLRVRAVRPRDAATLILVRRDGSHLRLLMGRRNHGHSFMPGKWVFPGGRIDRSDFRAPYASDLRPEVLARLEKTGPQARVRALALAAVRETFEEAGLLLARPAPARPAAGPWRAFLALGAEADLSALDFIARAITPPGLSKRFDARFFMAEADRLISLDRQPDCGELDEIAWVNMEEALALDLPKITRFVLGELAIRLEDPTRPAPFIRSMHGIRRVTHL